jgi:hypothetical protein
MLRDVLFLQFRRSRDLSVLARPDDILDCSIDERERSQGYLSTTYKLVVHFRYRAVALQEHGKAIFPYNKQVEQRRQRGRGRRGRRRRVVFFLLQLLLEDDARHRREANSTRQGK